MRLAFCHIAKTGGNSFASFIRERLSDGVRLNNPNAAEVWNQFHAQLCAVNTWVWGHFPLGTLRLPEDTIRVVVLRDPLERLVSNYRYIMTGEPQNQEAKDIRAEVSSFGEFIRSESIPAQIKIHRQLLSLSGFWRRPGGMSLESLATRAFVGLKHPRVRVGTIDRMQELADSVADELGIERGKVGHENPTDAPPLEISDEDRAYAETVLAEERRVYEWARQTIAIRRAA